MTPEARAMLDRIDEFLMRNDEASAEVAAVLTALRSDDRDRENKLETTIPIRRAAFPKLTKVWEGAFNGPWVGGGQERFMSMGGSHMYRFELNNEYDDHFSTHAYLAAEALGLEIHRPTTSKE